MPKLELTSHERSALRAAAHPLRPVVLIGDRGLSASVLNEIDRGLTAHELIKVRVAGAEREEREAMLEAICEALSCAAVHHLGKTLIIYRPDAAAQHAQAEARNATRALRKPSEPHIPKKQAALARGEAKSGHGVKPARAADGARKAAPAGAKTPARKSDAPDSRERRPGAQTRTPRRPAATPGIPRRSGGSALTLRAGARRGRTTRS
ncbi:YhbY family RNA-binding protein [Castellaniella sp. GW247-6E4]|uniref:YhbY family RNA-binding protein n=1 Tax=Castellaniella sp. GW247-6E4 TaxID=3140380 RepID=UPI003314B884